MPAFKLTEMKPWERPREKLHYGGAEALSDAELLAILIGSGNSSIDVMSICRGITSGLGHDLRTLREKSVIQLCRFRGIGEAKALVLQAAIELGRRVHQTEQPLLITGEEVIIDLVQPVFASDSQLHYILILMNRRNELLATCELRAAAGEFPDVVKLLELSLEAGAHSIALAFRGDSPTDLLSAEKQKLFQKDLESGAKMLSISLYAILGIWDGVPV